MSPSATVVPLSPPRWFRDVQYPSRSASPIQGQTVDRATEFTLADGYDMGLDTSSGPNPLWRQASFIINPVGAELGQRGGRWSSRAFSNGAGTVTYCEIYRFPSWTPALNPATAPGEDDSAHRIGWLRVALYTDPAGDPALETDAIGVNLVPDDGSRTAGQTAALNGGIGIFQRLGSTGWRYASYDAVPALLEATNLDDADGWHVADFIIRQAKGDEAGTPWLTLRWDGATVFSERAFGDPLLPAPSSFVATAQCWALIIGGRLATHPWSIASWWRFRQGEFHPDGYPVP